MISFLRYLAEAGICLGLFYLLYWIVLKKETFFSFNRFFLMLSIPLSFVIPLINIPSPLLTKHVFEKPFIGLSPVEIQPSSLTFIDVLGIVYFLGVGFFLIRLGCQLIHLFILIKRNPCQRHGCVKIVLLDDDTAPFSFFNYFFINRTSLSEQDFQRIITHELVHIKQYHSLDLIALELLTIVEWFNPFVRPYKKTLKETHEYLADHAVIAQGCSRAGYQLLIFEQHVGLKMFEFVNNFNHSQIKRRITMMTKNKSTKWAKFKFLLVIPVIGFLVLAFANPKMVRGEGQSGISDGREAVLSMKNAEDPALTSGNEADKRQAKKEKEHKLQELLLKEKKLKEEWKQTDDPEKKKKIEEMLMKIKQMKEAEGFTDADEPKKIMVMSDEQYAQQEQKLKQMIETTDNPDKKEQLKEKLEQLQTMKKKGLLKTNSSILEEEKKLKDILEKTENPEKRKLIKEKLLKLEALKKKIK
jgi:hypothetical protein